VSTSRLEAFSDAVIAIVITIMVLELEAPHSAEWESLRPVLPVFLTYVLSFVFLGIYWNNHHHMMHVTERVNGKVLWANLHLLFWLSLIPFVTRWMGESGFAAMPVAVYGGILLLAAVAWLLLERAIVRCEGAGSRLAAAVGGGKKEKLSAILYVLAIAIALVDQRVSLGIYVVVALMWLVPDRRIEALLP
jgi:uncharacterized membrane protein